MKILVAAIGKMRAGPEAILVKAYLARANNVGRNIGFSGPDIVELDAPNNVSGSERRSREGDLLLKAARRHERLFLLDETGDNLSSENLAELLRITRDHGVAGAAFMIGGADGHGQEIKKLATRTLSFGAATWPHMLVRAMLVEQLYRVMTILAGHPYHRS